METSQRIHFGRAHYFWSIIGIGVVALVLKRLMPDSMFPLAFTFAGLAPLVFRLEDIGADILWGLVCFVPVANVVLGFYLFCAPRDYAHTRISDPTMARLRLPVTVVCGLGAAMQVLILIALVAR